MRRRVIHPHDNEHPRKNHNGSERRDKADELGFPPAGSHQQLTTNNGKGIHLGCFKLSVSSLKPTREPAALGQALLGFFELAFFQLVEVVVQVGLHAAGEEVEAKHVRERHTKYHQVTEVENVGRCDDRPEEHH